MMHGQKGIAGEIAASEDMPFLTRQGYTPNILLNPLALPSRMTIGMLIECVLGVAMCTSALQCPEYNMPLCLNAKSHERPECVTKDVEPHNLNYPKGFNPETDYNLSLSGDATPYVKSFDINRVINAITKMGVNGFCEEEAMDLKTGEKYKCLIFTGVVYCQRLVHMAVDKMHARAKGGRHALHHQPVEGRKKGGGLRTGYMERDCMLAQGVPEMVQDRMLYQSDVFRMPVCQVCGLTAIDDGKKVYCRLCHTSKIVMVQLPYGTKLMSQEFNVLGLVPRIITLQEPK